MTSASRNSVTTTFYGAGIVACVLLAGCVPHQDVTPDLQSPTATSIIEQEEVSVSAADGVVFSIRSARLTVPKSSLEFDAYVTAALCSGAGLPADAIIPPSRKVLVALWLYTDVRVSGTWPVDFQILSDFGDANPYEPDFEVHRLNPETMALDPIEGSAVTDTRVTCPAVPGYTVITVPLATPSAIGLTGSQAVGHMAFPGTVMSGVDNAFGIRSTGTDFQRFTNGLAEGFRDRPYMSGDGNRLALVRESTDGASQDRIYGTTPSQPMGHLELAATALAGTKLGDLCFEASGSSILAAGHVLGSGDYGGGVSRVHLVGGQQPELLYRDPGPGLPSSVAASPSGAQMAVATARFFPDADAGSSYDVIVIPTSGPVDLTDEQTVRLTASLHVPPPEDPPETLGIREEGDPPEAPAEPLATVESLGFTPDGTAVCFGAYAEDEWRVYLASVDGASLVEIEPLRGYRWPAVSPDGTDIIVGRNDRLYLYEIATEDVDPVGPPANGFGAGLVSRGTTKISWRGR